MACTSRRLSDPLWTAGRSRALASSSAWGMLGPGPGTAVRQYRRGTRSAGPLGPPAASISLSTWCPIRAAVHTHPSLLSNRTLSVMNGTANGHHVVRPLTPGIHAPIPTFYQPETEDLGACFFPAFLPPGFRNRKHD